MEWATVQHLDLRHVGREAKPLQPHAAAFHPHQALIAAAVGKYIIEFDAMTGSKISTIDIGAPVVRMSYSPTSGHVVIAMLEDCTIRSCDFDAEQTCVLHSPERKMEPISSETEVHLALTPLQPLVFFGFHRRMSVTVVGTVEGGRSPTKIKTDLKKPIVNLACHPRLPVLYVAYAEGLIRAYNIHTYAVLYTLQLDNAIKLLGAGAFAFHPALEWIFVGDRQGTLLAWDVSTERPNMIGITQVGSHPIVSVAWLPALQLIATLSKDGVLQVWKTRVGVKNNGISLPPSPCRDLEYGISSLSFVIYMSLFTRLEIEAVDIPRILSQQGGEVAYPLPRVRALEIHPKLNLAALVFAKTASGDNMKNRAANTREGRKQLFAVLQSARGSSASVLKEKLASLGSSGVLADHQLQAQLQEHHLKGFLCARQNQLTISDIARKAFMYSHFLEGHAKSAPISRLPLVTILDTRNHLRDLPVCQPFQLELNFFSKAKRVLVYPVRAFFVDDVNLMAYNLSSGADSIYKKLYSMPGNVEYRPKNIIHSRKQNLFLVVYELNGVENEVVLYRENTDSQLVNSKDSTVKGRDAAFVGPHDGQFAILDNDKTGLALYILPGISSQELDQKNKAALEENPMADAASSSVKGPLHFLFESEVDRIFSTPLESTLMFASHGNQLALAKLVQGYRLSVSDGHGHYISTTAEGRKSIKLKVNEIVLQVHWQETLRGHVAGVMTTHRVLIVSADLEILATSSTKSLLWIGPALFFSTATAVCVLGWDGKVRTVLSTSLPNAARGSPVCGDLAVSLSQAGPQFTQDNENKEDPTAIQSRILMYGQFDSAKETFEVISDYESMLDLFICHLNPSAMRRLAQKLEEDGADPELRRYCERILRVRSTGWTQGIFANFAAESMVPKGPEWGGGNWEIKTPTNMKDIPQWELAAEVMPYMKTDDGPIPAIVTDHIGVYLGCIRGRGHVVEVREDSLVKAIASAGADSKPNGSPPYLADSTSGRGASVPDSKGTSLMGLETLIKQPSGSSAADEQAKAEEEFKKSMYSGGDSSDDEEGEKAKKFQIRIRDKPASSATVDVNKIKEATRQFSLAPPMGRTKSLAGGTQDLGLTMQPATTAATSIGSTPVSAPKDPFGTDALAGPPAVSQPSSGVGVTAGPIPEDFFQNTIPSLQVAASLAPPGIIISKLDGSFQGVGSNQGPVNHPSLSANNISLPEGGVPPGVTQQATIPIDSIGLPDGGIPPQSTSETIAHPQPQVLPAQLPMSTQPLDLSVLGVPGEAADSGKPPVQHAPSPASVRPGQVPRGAAASVCFKTGLVHLEQNQLPDALSCFDEAFLALAKDQSRGSDIKAQATICAQYKIAVTLLQEIGRLQRVQGPAAISAKDEMARLSRHLGSLPLLAKHRISCIRTAIKRNMEVQNYAYSKQMLELLLSKAPSGKQEELRTLIDLCVQRGLTNKSIDPMEDPSQFCAATLSRLSTIGYDVCDLCGAKFAALSAPGCIICGMGSIKRSDSLAGPVPSPFG
ncbi:hypothetical protein Cgig2_008034 [Carnegiea gigantea]|uniref:Transducin/WD40 repeat-like superfamily protein n=1 Tax=Carnegiea gigantea TaxID=171969 RepID=A0A9Q1QUW5_9CARY|nr:hypothetical protein Cgig2_008034 [Carnegiea gigantea]